MTDLQQKLSAWAKLYKRRDSRGADADFSGDRAPHASNRQMCAMEVELRAMGARADTSLDDAMAALKSSSRPKG